MSTQKPERDTEITYKIGTVLRKLNPPPLLNPKYQTTMKFGMDCDNTEVRLITT